MRDPEIDRAQGFHASSKRSVVGVGKEGGAGGNFAGGSCKRWFPPLHEMTAREARPLGEEGRGRGEMPRARVSLHSFDGRLGEIFLKREDSRVPTLVRAKTRCSAIIWDVLCLVSAEGSAASSTLDEVRVRDF